MKKIISVILCLTLLMSVGCIASADNILPEVNRAQYNTVLKALTAVGIVDKDVSLSPDTFITYKEFIDCISKLIGTSTEDTAKMYGVPESLYNEVITYENAVKIVVNLLGWEYKASKTSYEAVANSLDLGNGILNRDSNFARYDAYILIYNSLTADYLEQIQYGTENKYSTKESTLLSLHKDIYEFSGVLQANKWSSIYSSKGLGGNRVTIDDDELGVTEFDYFGTDSMDLLGSYIKGFYKDNGNKLEVVFMESDSEELIIRSENKPNYNNEGRTIRYTTDNGNEKKIAVPMDATIVMNGKSFSDPSIINDASFAELDAIRLYKYDGKYKAIHFDLYTDAVADAVSTSGMVIGYTNGQSVSFESDDINETVFLLDENGNPIHLSDIKSGNVISIYKSAADEENEVVVRLHAYDSSFVGKVTAMDENDGTKHIHIAKYSVNEITNEDKTVTEQIVYQDETSFECALGFEDNLEIGDSYKFYTDKCNKITYAEIQKNGERLSGLYIKIATKTNGLSTDKFQIFMKPDLDSKIDLDADVFDISKNAKIDYEKNGSRKTVSLKNADLSEINSILMHTAMYYSVNSNGEITRIKGYSSKRLKGYLYNFNPEGIMLGAHNIVNGSFDVSKYYSTNASSYGGSNSINGAPIVVGDANTYYGKNYIKYGELAKSMIIMPILQSANDVDVALADTYYKKGSAADYGYAVNHSFAYFNAFSHDGDMLPVYGTIAYDPNAFSIALQTKMPMINTGFLVNKVSWVSSDNGQKTMKLDGMFGTGKKTLYTASEKIIDVNESTADSIKYMSEISEGDYLFLQRDANGDITQAIKLCDFDPVTKNIKLIGNSQLFTIYKDSLTGRVVNDAYSDVSGIYNINTIASRRLAFLGYPYKITKQAYANSLLGVSYVIDDEKLRNAADPKHDPEQYEFKSLDTGMCCLYYDTTLDEPVNRIGTYSLLKTPSYFDDPDGINPVFVYLRSGEIMATIIYKKH